MQCVILAAGKGSRMLHLTENTPKPLVTVCGKAILDHIVEALPPEITEIILVTSYLEEQIKEYCGNHFHGRSVQYVSQDNPKGGTGDALMCVKDLVKENFLFMYADDIHGALSLSEVVKQDHAMLATKSDTPEKFGVLTLNEDGTLKEIEEKPMHPKSNLVNIGGFVINTDIFNYEAEKSDSGEMYVTDMITAYAGKYPVKVIEQDLWIPIGSPEQLEIAETKMCLSSIDSNG
jgi:NDP-sugar pyrophosphorylase family protein